MAGDLRPNRMYGKHHNQTKKFLEDACTLIELGNLVENFRGENIKLCEPCIINDKVDTCHKIQQKPMKASRESAEERVVSKPKKEAEPQATRQILPTLNKSCDAKHIRKVTKPKPCPIDSKKLVCKLRCLQAEIREDNNQQANKSPRKRQSITPASKKERNVSSALKRRLLASNLDIDMTKCMQMCLLKEPKETKRRKERLLYNESVRKKSTVMLRKNDFSKCSLKTWKSFGSYSDTFLFKNVVKQNSNERDIAHGASGREPVTLPDRQLPLQFKVNLQLKPNSKTMNLQITSSQETDGSVKNKSDVINFRLPFKCGSSANREVQKCNNELSSMFSIEWSGTTPSAQTSNDRKIQFLRPYVNTQAVYSVYDVERYHQPGQMKGIRSHLSFSMNIGRSPQIPQGRMPTGEVHALTAPPSGRLAGSRQVRYNSKVNCNSGSTSMQQSFSLGRSPQSESPYESDYCVTDTLDSQQSESAVCDTCCQENVLQRTRQRIVDRVGYDSADNPSLLFSPRAFFNKLCEKYKCINSKVEAQRKNVGSCTCSPFIETEQFSVEEQNVDPECSLLKRCFGKLIFNNKCVVCTEEKRVGTKYKPLKTYECEPGTCVEKKDPFACFKKFCKKKKPKIDDKKKAKQLAKEKAKKAKAKALEKQKRTKAKAKKELERKNGRKKKMLEKAKREREKLKGRTSGTSFITSIIKKPAEEDDRQKLLSDSDEGKKSHKKDKDDKGKEKEGGGTDFENKAKKTLSYTRRGYRRLTRRIREKYYRNKKLAEEQKGQYACDFYLMSLRNKPCLWVYYLCPVCYPYTLQALNLWRQVSDLLLFFVAIIVWSPCILCAECLKVVACNMCVS